MTKHGDFVWHELMTTDLPGARKFYTTVVGWGEQDSQMPGFDYWMFTAAGAPAAGMMALTPEMSAMKIPPHWTGYIGVEDVDAATREAEKLGGKVHRAPEDIPGVGRFSVVADPQGAVFQLFRWTGDPLPDAPMGTPGHVGWNELYAGDWQAVFPFYSALFGWVKDEAIPMGEMGTYQLFRHGQKVIGGMMNRPPNVPMAVWTYYFNVESIEAAAERVKAAGGQIIFGPQEVPGGSHIIMGIDPQGAHFALTGKLR